MRAYETETYVRSRNQSVNNVSANVTPYFCISKQIIYYEYNCVLEFYRFDPVKSYEVTANAKNIIWLLPLERLLIHLLGSGSHVEGSTDNRYNFAIIKMKKKLTTYLRYLVEVIFFKVPLLSVIFIKFPLKCFQYISLSEANVPKYCKK